MSDSRRRGIFRIIRSRQDALNVVTDTSIVFLLVAAFLAGLYVMEGERILLHVGLFGFLGVMLWRFKSPIAAITLLLESIMWLFVTVALFVDTGELNWIYVTITAIVILTSIRAAEATLKLIGRYAAENRTED
ncbi:MAG TPA: hypothetical protein VN496_10835 [Burkholderiales bacterium]|nr:hypothetical protein [Burkholderiales bacterium]